MYFPPKSKYNHSCKDVTAKHIDSLVKKITYIREDTIMQSVQVSINTVDKVKSFVNDITKFEYDFDLVSGRYVVNAKSIMGIFSLDIRKPICLNIHTEENTDEVLDTLAAYMV